VLTPSNRFVIVPDPVAGPSREYRAIITCAECDWSTEIVLRANEAQRLLCGACGNVEKVYLGIPDEFVGAPCPQCHRAATKLEREAGAPDENETLRLFCPKCGWKL
jgi:ribosomal protein S27AE